MYKIKFFKQKKNNSTLPSAFDYNYNEENVSVQRGFKFSSSKSIMCNLKTSF